MNNQMQEAADKSGGSLDIRYHLAAAHARAGNKGMAKSELEDILAANSEFSEREDAQKLLDSLR